ncbi:hypothetical protein MPTK1_3g03090 [Marchantia polymorpha subsp. ruderalis]|uniref:Uncharacterized protein n=2 Tax=Marchantia polymorpha TaxID=3197 RepID=A0AAF6AWX5_MARPO|nr:hypothetical protein MARPO_0007s0291 [Marchantia polymorpha]BBN04259.1 hypothetical protein Mp_3g03090 [Marchantia polymorpha subsp. ruderalis]|eukprot:PTQ47942.1 hypothetical protein MARPO_0007s0291 [Marchantia polymorpha]
MATTTVEEASTDGGAKGAPVWEKGAGPAGGGEPGHTRTVCFSSGNPRMESTRGVMHCNTTPDSGSADQLPIATENHHRLTTQLERQKQYYEGLLEDAETRTDSSISLAVEKATSPELQRMQQDMKKVQEENKSLQQVNQIHLDNQKRRQQKSKERKERGTSKIKKRDEQITNLEKQVQDLMDDIEAPKMRESSANPAELGEGTIMPHSVSIDIRNHPASNNIQPQTTPEVLISQAISEIEKKGQRSLLQKRPKDVKDSEIEKKERRSLLQKSPKDVKDSEIEKKERTRPTVRSIAQINVEIKLKVEKIISIAQEIQSGQNDFMSKVDEMNEMIEIQGLRFRDLCFKRVQKM